jgi:hypothetical protein
MLTENALITTTNSDISVQAFEKELKCHLPISVIDMRAAALGEWPQFGQFRVLFAVYCCFPLQKRKRTISCAFVLAMEF